MTDLRITPILYHAGKSFAAKKLDRQDVDIHLDPSLHVCTQITAPLYARQDPCSAYQAMLLFGDLFEVYYQENEWVWGQSVDSAYAGWVLKSALSLHQNTATHRVRTKATHTYPAPDIKVPPVQFLSFGSQLHILSFKEKFAVSSQGFIPRDHLCPINEYAQDYVALALLFLGTPYLWGGESIQGIDCSGLIHRSCLCAGIPSPRDADMQYQQLGYFLENKEDLRRGDLVFWEGHVGMMLCEHILLHSNAYHMQTVKEPYEIAQKRIEKSSYGKVIGRKRLPFLKKEDEVKERRYS